MPRKSDRPPSAPPNLAARSLAEARHRAQVVKSRKVYTRKIKHKNRDRDPGSFLSNWPQPGVLPRRAEGANT